MNKRFLVFYFTITFITNSIAQNTQGFKIHIDLLNEEIMLSVLGKDFYKKDSAWKPILDRAILVISLIIILSFLLFTMIWLIKRFVIKLSKKEIRKIYLLPRLVPLLSVIFLLTSLVSLSIWFRDYNNAGNISIVSILVFTSSILFPLFSLSSIWVSFFKNKSENRESIFENSFFSIGKPIDNII